MNMHQLLIPYILGSFHQLFLKKIPFVKGSSIRCPAPFHLQKKPPFKNLNMHYVGEDFFSLPSLCLQVEELGLTPLFNWLQT
jgi:hypothetical protein